MLLAGFPQKQRVLEGRNPERNPLIGDLSEDEFDPPAARPYQPLRRAGSRYPGHARLTSGAATRISWEVPNGTNLQKEINLGVKAPRTAARQLDRFAEAK
jgi:hypothetical protein